MVFPSRLLGPLVDPEGLAEGGALRLLDCGPANGATLAYLASFPCRLRVVDLAPSLERIDRARRDPEEEWPQGRLEGELRRALALPAGERFDGCLLWDCLHRLDLAGVRALFAVLRSHLAPGARLHTFVALNRALPLRARNYGIVRPDRLAVSPAAEELPYRHTQAALQGTFGDLQVRQAILIGEGRVELLLAAP
ncbi:MAG: hypothetical protein KatS3mg124_1094 [Porticoccaceae bacterium]|nr:MAG: hypothetical protein KatS3mg124_1094 [Porticoccaceae bacterium]